MRRLYTLLLIVGCLLGIKPVLSAQVRTKAQDVDLLPMKGTRTLSSITDKYSGEPGEGQAINAVGSRRFLNDTTGRFSAQRRDPVAYIQKVIEKQKGLMFSKPHGLEEAIRALEEDINGSTLIVKQILQLLLAERYDFLAKYYTYEKYEDWSVEVKDSLDALCYNKVMSLYDEALGEEATKQIPISDIKDLVYFFYSYHESASLYDYIAWQKLEYLMHLRADEEIAEQKLGIVDSMVFASAEVFSRHVFKQDAASPAMYDLVSHLQYLTKGYLKTSNTAMLEDIDLRRVQLMYQYGQMSNRDELYVKAIKREMRVHEQDTVYAEWGHLLAEYHYYLGQRYSNNRKHSPYKQEIKVAYDMANTILAKYPNSLGAELCEDLIASIKNIELYTQVEAINPLNTPILAHIAYQNIPVLYHRVLYVPEDKRDLVDINEGWDRSMILLRKDSMNDLEIVDFWKSELLQTEDFQPHNIEVRINPLNKAGIYILVNSVSPDFSTDTITEYILFEVSNIAYSYCDNNGQLDISVFDRLSGQPISNAAVSTYHELYDSKNMFNRKDALTASVYTDDKGQAVYKESDLGLWFSKDKDCLKITDHEVIIRTDTKRDCYGPQFNFILDKTSYGIHDTVYFKGWITTIDSNGQFYKDSLDKEYEIGLYTDSYKVANVKVKPNAYGAFQGTFLLSSSIYLSNEMSVKEASYSSANSIGGAFKVFGIVDYEPHQFIVTTDIANKTYDSDDIINVRAWVKSPDGSAIEESKASFIVKQRLIYRVKSTGVWIDKDQRSVFRSEEMPIAPDGSFNFRVPLSTYCPLEDYTDLSFVYQIEIIISSAPFDRYRYTIVAKLDPSQLDLDVLPVQDINDLQPMRLVSQNTNNIIEQQNGTLLIEELVVPVQALSKRAWKDIRYYGRTTSFIEHPTMSSSAFNSSFPNMAYNDEDEDMANWSTKRIISKNDLSAKFGSPIALSNRGLEANNVYRISFKYLDTKGDTIALVKYLSCCDLQKQVIPPTVPLWVVSEKPNTTPYEQATIYFGTAFKDAYVFYSIEQDKKIILKDVLKVNKLGKIKIPLRLIKGNYFVVHAMLTKDGRTYTSQLTIEVPFTRTHLKMNVEVASNQLFLKQGNQYCMAIEHTPKNKGLCQLLTSIYNASLDVFMINKWGEPSTKDKAPQLVWVYDSFRLNEPYHFLSMGHYYNEYSGLKRYYPYIEEFNIRRLFLNKGPQYRTKFKLFSGLRY